MQRVESRESRVTVEPMNSLLARDVTFRGLLMSGLLMSSLLPGLACSTIGVLDPTMPVIPEYPELDGSILAERTEEVDSHFVEPRSVEKVQYSLAVARKSISPVDHYESLWRCVRACAWLAQNHPEKSERYRYAVEGESFGRAAKQYLSNRVETHYYLAQCLGAKAATQSFPSRGLVKSMDYHIGVAYSLEGGKTFDHCGPARFWGTLMSETQDAGFGYTVGTLEQSLDLLSEACDKCPEFGENFLRFAQALEKAGEYTEARKALAKVLESSVPPDHAVEHRDWLYEAEELLTSLAGALDESYEATHPTATPRSLRDTRVVPSGWNPRTNN